MLILGILFLFIGDIFLKYLANTQALPAISWSFFTLAFFANTGLAFSLPVSPSIVLPITGVLILLFTVLLFQTRTFALRIALLSAILGALSNFIDRTLLGYTTDYAILFSRSAINIADILIVTGIGYYAWYYKRTDT